MGTIIVGIILVALIVLAIVFIIKAKRSGKHPGCGGNCSGCNVCITCTTHNSYLNSEENTSATN